MLFLGLRDLCATQALQSLVEQDTTKFILYGLSLLRGVLSHSLCRHHLFYSFSKGLWRSYPGTILSIFKIRGERNKVEYLCIILFHSLNHFIK